MIFNKSRIYVVKKGTHAVWSTSSMSCGVWRKDDIGYCFSNKTKPVGYVTTQFNPFSVRNSKRFKLINHDN